MRLITLLISLLFALPVTGQQRDCAPLITVTEKNRAYKEGEKLVYVIKYTWGVFRTDVGEAVTNLNRSYDSVNGDHFHSLITGYSYKFYDVFFRIKDIFESKFNTTNGRPFYFHRDISEGKYRMKNTYSFNSDYSINARVKRKDEPERVITLKGKECTFDLVSLFYYSRNIDFENIPPGVDQPVSFAIDDEIFNLYYRYIGKEQKRVPGMGVYRTLKFAARVVAGEVFDGKEELTIWVSDDENKVPLYFETPIIVGRVSGRLSHFENLKFPLRSKIK